MNFRYISWTNKSSLKNLSVSIINAFLLFGINNVWAGTTVYIPGVNGAASVINTSTQTQTGLLTGLGLNYSTAVSPNGDVAYIPDYTGNTVIPINTVTNSLGAPIAVGLGPVNVTFSADGSEAYVSNYDGNSISVIDVSTRTVSATVPGVCPVGFNGGGPAQSVINGSKLLFVCYGFPSIVRSMDTVSNVLATLSTVEDSAYLIAISASSGFGYVSNYLSGSVSKFDLTTGVATHYPTTGISRPLGLAVTPDGGKIYVADFSGSNLIVMNPSGVILTTLNLEGSAIAGLGMSSNGSVIYAPLRGTGAGIKVIDTATDTVTATIANPGASIIAIWGNFLANVTASASLNSSPVASAVTISGTASTGSSLSGLYSYSDLESDLEGTSTFRWVSNNVNTGVTGGINVGSSSSYTPVSGDLGSYLYFCVTPVATTGTTIGTEACSAATAAVIAGPVNGVCGSASNLASYEIPSTNLCNTGIASQLSSMQGQYSWTCSGTGGGANASCTAPWASNAGTGTGSLSASGNTWTVTSASFTAVPAATPPAGVTFPNGILDLQLGTGTSGSNATVVVQYSTPVPAGAVYMKYGKTQSNQTDHWYQLPSDRAVFAQDRMSVTLTLTDGGVGDHDLAANGSIVDPGGPALVTPTAIPTLTEWTMIVLAGLMGLLAFTRMRRSV